MAYCISHYYSHRYMDARHTSQVHISLLHMHVWFLYSCHMDHRSSYMYYCSMLLYLCYIIDVHVLLFHVTVFDCFLLLICIFPLLDMRAVDMRYVEFHIYCSRYIVPVTLFPLYGSRVSLYCSLLSTELWSSYHVTRIMYCTCSCYIVYLTYQIRS